MPRKQRLAARISYEQTSNKVIELVRAEEGLRAADIAERLNANKGVVIRILTTAHRRKQLGRFFDRSDGWWKAKWMSSYEKYHEPSPLDARKDLVTDFNPYPGFDEDCRHWLKPREKPRTLYNPWQR
jgi:hypothetical protein